MASVLEAARNLISDDRIRNEIESQRSRFSDSVPEGNQHSNMVMLWAKHQFRSYPAKNRLFNNLNIWGNQSISPIVASIMGLPEDRSAVDPETSLKMAAIFLMDQEIPDQADKWSSEVQATIEGIWSRKFK